MRSLRGSVPITTRLACGRKPSRWGTIVSSASGESARSWTEGGSGSGRGPEDDLAMDPAIGPEMSLEMGSEMGPELGRELGRDGGVSSPAVSGCVIPTGCGAGQAGTPAVKGAVDNSGKRGVIHKCVAGP